MDEFSLKVLEFDHLRNILKTYAVSPLGRRRCETLRPTADPSAVQSRFAHVSEMKTVLETGEDLPIHGLKDTGPILDRLDVEGTTLTPQELIDLCRQIELTRGVKRFLERLDEKRFPRLRQIAQQLQAPRGLEKEILHAVDAKGEILDRASVTLSEIRHRLRTIREKVKGLLEQLLRREDLRSIFQEEWITLRNGRYVLPVKAEHKHRLQGIVHDQSQSERTYFIEPFQAVSYNNETNILVAEEKEEEYRILRGLTHRVRQEVDSLRTDLEILGEIDQLYAIARFSISLKATEPLLNFEGRIDLREARHPLLALQTEREVVPIHLRMGENTKVLILSGANAGGKTVALKTLGLLTLMVQSGLPIPVSEGSEAALFEGVFAMIGDEQDISEHLSTFSSHLLHLNRLLDKAGPRSLVLLDELCVGTDVQEGAALAMGYLDRFRAKGSFIMVTTHFERLKAYGYFHPDVQNVAVEFDQETLEPRYTLSYGTPGQSNAFLVAEKLGVPRDVLISARRYLDGGEEEVSRLIHLLQQQRQDLEREQKALITLREEVGLEQRRLKEVIEGIRKRKQEILVRAEEKAKKMAQQMEEELKAWVRLKKEEDLSKKSTPVREFRKVVQEVRQRTFPMAKGARKSEAPVDLRVGEYVKIESLGRGGVVTKIEEPLKRVEVWTERGRVKTSLSDVFRAERAEVEQGFSEQREGRGTPPAPSEVSSELNVMGFTVDEAIPVVDKFIDQALLHGLKEVQIIHGVGSGRLRGAIGQFLHDHRGVKGFVPGEGRGGAGVTVVELF